MISTREFLLALLLPALVAGLCGAVAARVPLPALRRGLQALGIALAWLLAVYGVTGWLPLLQPLGSATQLAPLLALPVALVAAFLPAWTPCLATLGLLALFFGRLGAPPGWVERVVAGLALLAAWSSSRPADEARPAWRAPVLLASWAGAVAFLCICGRVASLSLLAAGLGACAGAWFLASLRRPAWNGGRAGFDLGVFALSGTLLSAVYLGELDPRAALVLLAGLAATRLRSLAGAFGAELAAIALAIWIAWPADGFPD